MTHKMSVLVFSIALIFAFSVYAQEKSKPKKIEKSTPVKKEAIKPKSDVQKQEEIKPASVKVEDKKTEAIISSNETRGISIIAKDKVSGQPKEIKLYNKSYAVIIGIDQYPNLPFDLQLAYAVRDAKGVEQVLRKNFKFDKIITLFNKEASKDRIMEVFLGDLTKEITDEDAVFVFWAGHGYTEKTSFGDLGYLIPFDGTFKTTELYKNISMNMLKDDISKKIPAKHVFYVIDACYSGLLAATRGAGRQSSRDINYLQEITREKVRQVLTAGDKGQEVLDGGPKGHSVFTGRFLELLENTEDFITATEISSMVKEKVFSDAQARNHTQTPKYGELFGVGDFVFIPSLEQKIGDNQSRLSSLQKELEQLKATEEMAIKSQDERVKRQAEMDKRAIEARLKAEQLRQQALEDEQRKKADEEKEIKRQGEQIASLKREVEEKRKTIGVNLNPLSPDATISEMQQIDGRIKEIRGSFHKEFTNGIKQIFPRVAEIKKDEFESEAEYKVRLSKGQTDRFIQFQERLENEYNQQIPPLLERMKKLSENEFTLGTENLILELGAYDPTRNIYPLKIKTNKPIKGIQVAANTTIPIPRDEAKEFKLHFENKMLRPEIRGNFHNTELFRIAEVYITDDANNKKYDLFASRFLDLGNGIIYDNTNKLLWVKDGNYFKKELNWKQAGQACEKLTLAGLSEWRLPNREELKSIIDPARTKPTIDTTFFPNTKTNLYWSSTTDAGGSSNAWGVNFDDGGVNRYDKPNDFYVRCVRGGQ